MTAFVIEPVKTPLLGHVLVPGDKSIAHRALLLGALSQGPVRIRGMGRGADNQRSARAMAAMGAAVDTVATPDDSAAVPEVVIHGVGLDGLRGPKEAIDCGNSGTSMRLLCGLLAPQGFDATLCGDDSLSQRPMRRVIDPLTQMGARISGASGAKAGEIYAPLHISAPAGAAPDGAGSAGRLRGLDYRLPVASAQIKSAILLAGLYADGVTRVTEPGSARDHTERMLAHMGAPVRRLPGGVVELDPAGWDRRLHADVIHVPGDPSQAAFVLAAALIAGVERVAVGDVCINPTRTGFLDVLAAMNALIEREAMNQDGGEPVADLAISRGAGDALQGTTVSGDLTVRALDELPILAVVAARARGVTRFCDAAELRVKESDRIATTCAMLRALGCEVEEREDGFAVEGMPERRFAAARIDAAGDHRIAMAGAVAGLVAEGPVRIDSAACVDTSFPGFIDTMCQLGADMTAEA